jgi:ABC-type antimicrobial peptide transport system permease subunit
MIAPINLESRSSRASAWLVGAVGLTAMSLAAIGLYGVIACSIARRTREIGVRMALGASPRSIVRWVLARAGLLAGLGVAAGLVGAVGVTRLLRGALYGVAPVDPLVFGGLALFLPAVVLAAAYFPAWRASRLEPTRALQTE